MLPDATVDAIELSQAIEILETVDPASALYRRAREIMDSSFEVRVTPEPTLRREKKFLTIGMSTYDDYDGCYFSIQAIRHYHEETDADIEFVVVDNNPAGPCAKALKSLENLISNYRYIPQRSRQGTAVRDLVFREATGDFVLCIDSHVLFPPGALAKLIAYCRANPETKDLLQGPLIGDDLNVMATCFRPKWQCAMYGVWGLDDEGKDPDGPPFEIEMQGLGIFACRRAAWPGFNPRLDGFGGEEGYIHEKIRRAGGRNLCLPFLRWLHRFERPLGTRYESGMLDRVRNYLIIYKELGLDPAPVIAHFEEHCGKEGAASFVQAAQAELDGPLDFFDAIYCINLDRDRDRWEAMKGRLRNLGPARGIRRFAAADTPFDQRAGYALSHRRIVADAKLQQLQTVLVLDDDVRFSDDAAGVLKSALPEMEARDWQLWYFGGYRSAYSRCYLPGSRQLPLPNPAPCAHAIAYHHTVYDAILDAVPDNATDVLFWLRKHGCLDDFLAGLAVTAFLTFPVIATTDSTMAEQPRLVAG